MKYTIVINQYAITKLGLDKKTDLIDWAILDYLKDWTFATKKKTLTLDGKEYIWINYNHLLEQMPLLGFKDKHSIGDRIKKFKLLSLIETFQSKDNTLYFRFTHNVENLFFDKAVSADNIGYVAETTQGLCGQGNTAQVVYQSKENINQYIEQFEEFWKSYPKKLGKTAALKNWKTILKDKENEATPDDLVSSSKNYAIAMKGNEPKFILQASTFLGPQKRYEDYVNGVPVLTENKEPPKREGKIEWR